MFIFFPKFNSNNHVGSKKECETKELTTLQYQNEQDTSLKSKQSKQPSVKASNECQVMLWIVAKMLFKWYHKIMNLNQH